MILKSELIQFLLQVNILEIIPILWEFFSTRDLRKVTQLCKRIHDINWHRRKLPFLKLIKPVQIKNIFKEIDFLVLPTKLTLEEEQKTLDTLASESITINNLYFENYSGSIISKHLRVSGLAILRNHSLLFMHAQVFHELKKLLLHVKNKNELFTLLENGNMFPNLKLLSLLIRGEIDIDHSDEIKIL